MAKGHPIVRAEQSDYLEGLRPRDPDIVNEIESGARALDLEVCGSATARLLEILACAAEARRVLELGAGIGRSTLALASASERVRVTSVDRDGAVLATARGFLERAGLASRVDWVEGEAVEVLAKLEGPPYDLLFLDVDKADDRRCLDLGLRLLRVGAPVVVTHLLWRGEVAAPAAEVTASAEAAFAFNGYFVSHPQLSAVVLPVDDGVGIAVKRKPLVTDLGGPF